MTTPYRLYDVTLARKTRLSPAMGRFTFVGPGVEDMKTGAPDQRIKIFFPYADGRAPDLIGGGDWYARYKAAPADTRPPMRTYTIRALRREPVEVDVDFVLHGDTGPASRWATAAQPGDRVQILAPDGRTDSETGGYEWRPPAMLDRVLLIADETALPAAIGILEALAARPSPPRTDAYFEVPNAEDRLDLPHWPGLQVEWSPRDGQPAGAAMVEAAGRAWTPAREPVAEEHLAAVDIERQLLWDRADIDLGGFYAWVAGESAAVLAIRQVLVKTRGVDRRRLNLMGYWRHGRVLE